MIKHEGKKIALHVIAAIIIFAVGFWGGKMYGAKTKSAFRADGNQFSGINSGFGGGFNKGGRNGGGIVSGDIVSKDATGVVVKSREGGSKIVIVPSSAQIMKATDGTAEDLVVGKNVMVTGTTNADGSVTAKVIQLRNDLIPKTPLTPPVPAK
ncbi:MAG: hypothetical protein WC797_04805 [Candidatus Paceibacterota bacterium]|jgi:hypothetical protein